MEEDRLDDQDEEEQRQILEEETVGEIVHLFNGLG